jgi:hypothetical protein
MKKNVFPFYIQDDAIKRFYAQMFEASEQTKKFSRGISETNSAEKKINITLSLLQLLGLESALLKTNAESTDYMEEILQIDVPEDKLRAIRNKLSEQGILYNLNLSLRKERPFGSFVDFDGEAKHFYRTTENYTTPDHSLAQYPQNEETNRLIEIEGEIEYYRFKTVCSEEYVISKSELYMMTRYNISTPIIGFGIVTGLDTEKKFIIIKPLMLAFPPQGFRVQKQTAG